MTVDDRLSAGSLRRPPAVAGAFYPANPARLLALVDSLLEDSTWRFPAPPGGPDVGSREPVGILVPHAGLEYSGLVAAAGWRTLAADAATLTVVLLGTNHRAGWLAGVGVWPSGAWSTPLGDVPVHERLAAAIVGLGPPFVVDAEAHLQEHSLEVQLPLLQAVVPRARVVPLAVSTGTGATALEAGERLGILLAAERAAGARIVLAISTDMAHYPSARDASAVTAELLAVILEGDPRRLALAEEATQGRGMRGLVCGMCGIEPAVLGLAALGAMGARKASPLAAATSADAGAPPDRTVGYLAVRFD